MQRITAITLVLGIVSAPAFAGEAKKMSDQQLDKVTAGALVNIIDVADINQNQVQVAVPVNAAAALTVLGGVAGAQANQLGNITQRR